MIFSFDKKKKINNSIVTSYNKLIYRSDTIKPEQNKVLNWIVPVSIVGYCSFLYLFYFLIISSLKRSKENSKQLNNRNSLIPFGRISYHNYLWLFMSITWPLDEIWVGEGGSKFQILIRLIQDKLGNVIELQDSWFFLKKKLIKITFYYPKIYSYLHLTSRTFKMHDYYPKL